VTQFPHPQADRDGFHAALSAVLSNEQLVWNPCTQRRCSWIDAGKVSRKVDILLDLLSYPDNR
jgi:hypothetical protein